MGAVLKEAAREAANSSCFYRMVGRIGLAEGGAGDRCRWASSRYCFRDVRRGKAPRSPYFGKTRAANRSVFLRHRHQFSCFCSPLCLFSATARLTRTSGCRFHHSLPDAHGDQMGQSVRCINLFTDLRAGVVPRRTLPLWRDLSKNLINHESGTPGSAASFHPGAMRPWYNCLNVMSNPREGYSEDTQLIDRPENSCRSRNRWIRAAARKALLRDLNRPAAQAI